jgi:hypothetical protein
MRIHDLRAKNFQGRLGTFSNIARCSEGFTWTASIETAINIAINVA